MDKTLNATVANITYYPLLLYLIYLKIIFIFNFCLNIYYLLNKQVLANQCGLRGIKHSQMDSYRKVKNFNSNSTLPWTVSHISCCVFWNYFLPYMMVNICEEDVHLQILH